MRAAVPKSRKPRLADVKSFPAPTSGLIANQNRAITSERLPTGQVVRGAAVLENWFPTETGIRMRGGTARHATLGDGSKTVEALFCYLNGGNEKMFGATRTDIYDITAPGGTENFLLGDDLGNELVDDNGDELGSELLAVVSSTTSGDWYTVQFATTGGVFLVCVNGADSHRVYDGSAWATTPAITGVGSDDLNFVWAFKNRLFFVEKDSLNAWYLPVDQIGGAATKFPLAGVFTLGGSLLFGATVSSDAGSGMDDRCVFVSTEGEVAIYEGTNPAVAADWALVGVYRIGRPLGKRAHMRVGGDVMVASDVGLVSILSAVDRDLAALTPSAISARISTLWTDLVYRNSGTWQVAIWPRAEYGVVALPPSTDPKLVTPVVNVRTGAWCTFTGWDIRCMTVFGDRFFFGSIAGKVFEAEVSGSDDGAPYTASVIPLFDDCKTPAHRKVTQMSRATVLGPRDPGASLAVRTDYNADLGTAPSDTPSTATVSWGTGIWGVSVWGAVRERKAFATWRSTHGQGYTIAPLYRVTSGAIDVPDFELVRIDVTYEVGDIVS